MISDDDGDSWSYGGRLITDAGRPYLKYASNNIDVIHFINTEQHPRDYDNSIYHGYVNQGQVYNSNGDVLDNDLFDDTGVSTTEFTMVYQGGADNVAWTSDLALDENGHPYAAFSVQMNSAGLPGGQGGDDHRYHYARWDGQQWVKHEIAYAGTRLYSGEDDYTGNIALDPSNPDIVYISTDADPETGDPLISDGDGQRHYEVFKGETQDSGATWTWSPITGDSTAFLWMRGTYTTYTNYNTDIVGIIMGPPEVAGCTDPLADNFDSLATIDDGTCSYTSIKEVVITEPFSYSPKRKALYIPQQGRHTVKVSDLLGNTVLSRTGEGQTEYTFNEIQKTGIYLLQVTTLVSSHIRMVFMD
jgi:hypothetical protein